MGWQRKDVPILGAESLERINKASKLAAAAANKRQEQPSSTPEPDRQTPQRVIPLPTDKRRARRLAAEYSQTVSSAATSIMNAETPEARQKLLENGQTALDGIVRTVAGATMRNDKKAALRIYKSSRGVQSAAAAYVKACGHWYEWFFQWRLDQAEKKARGSRHSLGKG
jgi:hypothetical protein